MRACRSGSEAKTVRPCSKGLSQDGAGTGGKVFEVGTGQAVVGQTGGGEAGQAVLGQAGVGQAGVGKAIVVQEGAGQADFGEAGQVKVGTDGIKELRGIEEAEVEVATTGDETDDGRIWWRPTVEYSTEPEQEVRHPLKTSMDSDPDQTGSEEEAQVPKGIRAPKGPTKLEREEHDRTHLPFRAWCQHCVRGRGRNKPHRAGEQDDDEQETQKVPKVSMDYFFMSKEDARASENPMLTMKE